MELQYDWRNFRSLFDPPSSDNLPATHVPGMMDAIELAVQRSLNQAHFGRQVDSVRSVLSARSGRHFLLSAFEGRGRWLLPQQFGILLRLRNEQNDAQDFFVRFQAGSLESFHVPDLTAMGEVRAEQLSEASRHLSEKHLIPVQAVEMSQHHWAFLGASSRPWWEGLRLFRNRLLKLEPFRPSLVAWVVITQALWPSLIRRKN